MHRRATSAEVSQPPSYPDLSTRCCTKPAFSGKGRGVCPFTTTRRMAEAQGSEKYSSEFFHVCAYMKVSGRHAGAQVYGYYNEKYRKPGSDVMGKWLAALLLLARGLSAIAQTPEPVDATPPPAQAQASSAAIPALPRKYAVLSLVGDSINFTVSGRYYGKRPQEIRLSTPVFDQAALLAADGALKKARPGSSPLLVVPNPSLYAAQKTLVVDGKFHATPELDATLKSQQVTHLILISKFAAKSGVKVAEDCCGMGVLEGLGFYLNASIGLYIKETGESTFGFMAPYANYRASLIDLSQSAVVAERKVQAAKSYTSLGVKGIINPWEVRTQEQNMELLDALLSANVAASVAKLL